MDNPIASLNETCRARRAIADEMMVKGRILRRAIGSCAIEIECRLAPTTASAGQMRGARFSINDLIDRKRINIH
jgi:hypothetical protein